MQREALVLTDGRAFSVWQTTFSELKRERTNSPCMIQERDGSSRNGSITFTVESATVSFCASHGNLAAGEKGQLSSIDEFYEITISSVERETDHLRVSACAERRFDFHKSA